MFSPLYAFSSLDSVFLLGHTKKKEEIKKERKEERKGGKKRGRERARREGKGRM